MALNNVDLYRIDGTIGSVSNIQTAAINDGPIGGTRNRIINGDMRIDQRGVGTGGVAVPNATATYPVDRFYVYEDTAAVLSCANGTGPDNSLRNASVAVTTSGSATSGQLAVFRYRIEGLNVNDFLYGTADALDSVLSFWVQSSVPGTYCVAFSNNAQNRSYVVEYTISVANTWEEKIILIPGDVSGTWLTDTNIGIQVTWDLGSGSGFNGTSATWQATSKTRTTNQTNWINNALATFRLSGVQLELGTVATPFERRSFGQELTLCQRYYQLFGDYGFVVANGSNTGNVQFSGLLMTPMRATPTKNGATGTAMSIAGAAWVVSVPPGGSASVASLSAEL